MILILGSLGCSNPSGDSSTVDSGHLPGVTPVVTTPTNPPARGSEFVAASQQQVSTMNGKYKVEAALGSPTKSLELQTTQGHELYSNVQGQILTN